jgi:hypothetical protein
MLDHGRGPRHDLEESRLERDVGDLARPRLESIEIHENANRRRHRGRYAPCDWELPSVRQPEPITLKEK